MFEPVPGSTHFQAMRVVSCSRKQQEPLVGLNLKTRPIRDNAPLSLCAWVYLFQWWLWLSQLLHSLTIPAYFPYQTLYISLWLNSAFVLCDKCWYCFSCNVKLKHSSLRGDTYVRNNKHGMPLVVSLDKPFKYKFSGDIASDHLSIVDLCYLKCINLGNK